MEMLREIGRSVAASGGQMWGSLGHEIETNITNGLKSYKVMGDPYSPWLFQMFQYSTGHPLDEFGGTARYQEISIR